MQCMAWQVHRLQELVHQHLEDAIGDVFAATTQRGERDRRFSDVNWEAIAAELNRPCRSTTSKWHDLQRTVESASLKHGRFSEEEDELVKRRVLSWGDRKAGLWTSLQQELGRPAQLIRHRWNQTISKTC